MKHYKENDPTNDLYIFIYRIAGKLSAEGLTAENYSKNKAIKLVQNCVLPSFCEGIIKKYSNQIIINL
jgi:hypothetical protein